MVISKAARKLLMAGAALGLVTGGLAVTATAQDNSQDNAVQASDPAETYSRLLQHIADLQVSTDQRRLYLNQQEEEIAALEQQIATLDATKASVRPLVVEMAAEAEKEMVKDIPFKIVQRFARLDRLKEDLAEEGSPISSLFRQAMNLYELEVISGNSIEAYGGEHPTNPGTRLAACDEDLNSNACDLPDEIREELPQDATRIERPDLRDSINDGAYVHFGRLSLIYLQHDSSEAWRWDQPTEAWVEMSGSDVLDARRAVRIARGESAPGVILSPIRING
ncbi:DUF3450 family protein [Litorimonas sp.]|uniref:DUF3450 family protein n=1 Tax=Litorimonas sp. TaxID=1892381 RepID=UPI003A85AAB4